MTGLWNPTGSGLSSGRDRRAGLSELYEAWLGQHGETGRRAKDPVGCHEREFMHDRLRGQQTIEGIEALGYTFVDPASL